MNKVRRFLFFMCAAVMAAFAPTTQAGVLSLGDTYTFNFGGTGSIYDLFSSGTVQLTGLTATTATLTITLNNISQLTGGGAITPNTNARLTAWGFAIDPNATAVSFVDAADGGMIDASLDSIPSFKEIEICAFGGVNCPGGAAGGIFAGNSDSFQLLLTGTWGSSVTIDPLGEKFQTDKGSFEFASTCETGSCGGGTVPEPAPLALLAAGMIGFAFTRRKKQ